MSCDFHSASISSENRAAPHASVVQHVVLSLPPYGVLFGTPTGTPALHEPLGLEYVAASVEKQGHACMVTSTVQADPVSAAIALARSRADVFGFGLSTPASSWLTRVVAKIRELCPAAVIVVGGDHPSSVREAVLEDRNIDYGVVGEGEEAFTALLDVFVGKGRREEVPGLLWRDSAGKPRANPAKVITDLNRLPPPVRSADVLASCRVDGLVYPAPSTQRAVAQVMQSRGCPHACSFCASRLVFGSGIRFRDPSLVASEMVDLAQDYDVNLAFFADLHLGAEYENTKALCRAIVGAGNPVPWYACMTTSSMSKDMAEGMAAAGCTKVAFGIESMHPATHRQLRPWSNVEGAAAAAVTANSVGLLVRAYYMLGIPGETSETFRQGIEALCRLPVDELRIAFFTPFPGTPAYRRHKDLLLTNKAEDFTSAKPVLDLPGYPPAQQEEDYRWAVRRFYEGPGYGAKWREKLRRNPVYETSYAEFLGGLKRDGLDVDM